MRRKYVEIVMSIGAVGVILLVLISFDPRVREEASRRWESGPTAELASGGQQARQIAAVVGKAARDRGLANTQVFMMLGVAGVLVVFMVKIL
jgi:hypothetical protein